MFDQSFFTTGNEDSGDTGSIYLAKETSPQESIFAPAPSNGSALSAGTSNSQGSKSRTNSELSSAYNIFDNGSSGESSHDIFSISTENQSLYKQDYDPNATASIFDSRNDTKDSNNLAGSAGGSVFAELNMRERNEGNLSIVDRMRGIEGKRLDNSGEISLADQYNDASLDKRAMGGAYNITLVDTYKDKRLWNAVHGLNFDGMVENEEEGTQSQFRGKKIKEVPKESQAKGPVDLTKGIDFSKKSWESESEVESVESTDDEYQGSIIGGSLGFKDSAKNPLLEGKNIDKKKIIKKSKLIGVDKSSIMDYKLPEVEPIKILTDNDTEKGVKRVRLNEELIFRAKEINLRYGKNVITSQEIEEMERGGAIPFILMSYKDLKEKMDNMNKTINSDASETEKEIAKVQVNKIKPILFKKAIEGI